MPNKPRDNDAIGCGLFLAGLMLLLCFPPAGIALIIIGGVLLLAGFRLW